MAPPSLIRGSAFWTVKRSPRTLVPKVLSKFSSVVSTSDCGSMKPELATRPSMLPFSSLILA